MSSVDSMFDIVTLLLHFLVGFESAQQAEDLGSNPSERMIFNLFRCDHSSLLPWRSVLRSNFDRGLHNLIVLTKKRSMNLKVKLLYIYSIIIPRIGYETITQSS